MRARGEVDRNPVDDAQADQVDDIDVPSIGAGLSEEGVAVDGQVRPSAIGSGGHFVRGEARGRDAAGRRAGSQVDHLESLIALAHDEEAS